MQSLFQVDQVLDLTIGSRMDNKVFRAQVVRLDDKDLVLHVPGFDPLYFVDILKGTDVVLGVEDAGERFVLPSRIMRHFKSTSPYLVVRRPRKTKPIKRKAVAMFRKILDIEYIPYEGSVLRESESPGKNELGKIFLCSVPEPFDIGTPLRVIIRRKGGIVVDLEGRVARVSRDSSAQTLYQVDYSIERLSEGRVSDLLGILLSDTEEESNIEPLEDEGRRRR